MRQLLTICFFFCFPLTKNYLLAQSTFSLEAHTIGMHFFGNPNLRYYENNLDSLGFFCVEPGLMVSYEFFIKDNWLSMQLSQSIFADAAGLTAGFTKWSLRYMFFHKFRNQLYIDIAPAITYRRAWNVLGSEYVPETNYRRNGKIEYRPSVIAKIEYDIFIGNNNDINMSLMYGNAYKTISFMLGYRHWISTKVRSSKSCDCFGFKKKNIFRRIFR